MDDIMEESIRIAVRSYVAFIQQLFATSDRDPRAYLHKRISEIHRLFNFEVSQMWQEDYVVEFSVIEQHIFACAICQKSFWSSIQEYFHELLDEI